MSLQQIAQAVQSRGRGEDSVLIHMTPKEVQGLQALAMAHGGSLTTNPDTGLPEAGFLSSLLPTLIGAGLSFIPGVGPLMAAGLVGGGTALATGNLQKGLMAGLGAYGGAGLASGLAGLGSATPAAAAGAAGVSAAGEQAAMLAAQQAGFGQAGLEGLAQAAGQAAPTAGSVLSQGASAALQSPSAFVDALGGGKQALRYGLAAAGPIMADQMVPTVTQRPEETPYLYQFNQQQQQTPTQQGPYTSERQYFTEPTLTRIPGFAEGGMTGASKEAFEYLMGRSDVSPARTAAQERMVAAPVTSAAAPVTEAVPSRRSIFGGLLGAISGKSDSPVYNFDPRTGGLMRIAPVEQAGEEFPMRRYTERSGGNYGSMGYGRDSGVNNSAGSGYGDGTSLAAEGGLVGLAKGGMAKGGFVVPADVVSMLGDGSTDAGIRALQAKYGPAVKPIKGPGTGQSDSIPTTIEGKQPARVADGEAYIPPAVISKHGGAKKFYSMLDNVRTASQGHTKQQRRVNPAKVMA